MKKIAMIIIAVIMSVLLASCAKDSSEDLQYTVEYLDYDGSVLQSEIYMTGDDLSKVTAPENPARDGYTFDSWNGILPETMGEKSVVLIASYTVNQYIVQFLDFDGTVLQTEDYNFGADLSAVAAPTSPERVGYTFNGWSGMIPATMGAEEITLTATYTINSYTLEYVDYNGTVLQTEDYAFGSDLTSVTEPVKSRRDGYTFDSWSATKPTIMGTESISLTAIYTMNQYSINYNLNGGRNSLKSITEYNIEDDTINLLPARKTGSTFMGWYTTSDFSDGVVTEIRNGSFGDIDLYAKWELNQYTINYNLNGGRQNINNVTTYTIESSTITLFDSIKTEAVFLGWYNTRDFSGDVVTEIPRGSHGDIDLYAKWAANEYSIEYRDFDGAYLQTTLYEVGADLSGHTAPADPEREGYTFDDWIGTVPAIMGSDNVIIVASYIVNEYVINFDLNGGNNNLDNISTYTIEDLTFILLDATKENHLFMGWYTTADFSGQVITEIPGGSQGNIDLYAKWQEKEYTVFNVRVDSSYDASNPLNLRVGEIVIATSLGSSESAAITSEGRLFTWGQNYYGQLGDGTTTNIYTPTDITNQFNLATGEKIIYVSIEETHAIALTSEGRVFTWGGNYNGQLGDGTSVDKTSPIDITSQFSLNLEEEITSVAIGNGFSSAITSEGRIFTWGKNYYGQLGDGLIDDRHSPTDITSSFSFNTGERIELISLGGYQAAVLTSEGRVFTWGRNTYGQLGDGTTTVRILPSEITSQFNLAIGERVTCIVMDYQLSAVITSEGRLFTWGHNSIGGVGDGTNTTRFNPTDITSLVDLAIGEKIISVSLGLYHSSAITSEGKVFIWGDNREGRLGDGTTTNRFTPIEITSQFNFLTGEDIKSLSLGDYYSSAVTSLGRVFTWGSNESGKLGDGTATRKSIPLDITEQFNYISPYEEIVNVFNADLSDEFISYAGYTFDGWYIDSDLSIPFNGTLMPDYPLYALYIKD